MSRSNVCIVDYGVGNLQSIRNAVKISTGQDLDLVGRPEELAHYGKIILPGVGAFGDAMTVLRERGLDQAVKEEFRKGRPLLGICVGMQVLAEKGFEHGTHEGLGIIPGVVKKLEAEGIASIHMGWNDIQIARPDPIFIDVPDGTDFYFVHGYHLETPAPEVALATCTYGETFPVVVRKDNAWGVQFHPEKSQQQGINILRNFVSLSLC
jgi:imidazole glycerol-phosphate synthase subunit HisH